MNNYKKTTIKYLVTTEKEIFICWIELWLLRLQVVTSCNQK